MLVTKHLTVAIDFHFVGEKYTMEVNGSVNCYQQSSEYIFFQWKKVIHTGLEQVESE